MQQKHCGKFAINYITFSFGIILGIVSLSPSKKNRNCFCCISKKCIAFARNITQNSKQKVNYHYQFCILKIFICCTHKYRHTNLYIFANCRPQQQPATIYCQRAMSIREYECYAALAYDHCRQVYHKYVHYAQAYMQHNEVK